MIASILLKFIVGHLIGDFLCQPDAWVKHKIKNKIKSGYLYLHILIHLISLLVLFQGQYIVAIAVIVISHYLIDVLKLYLHKQVDRRLLFFADQIAHLLVIALVVYYIEAYTINLNTIFSDYNILIAGFLIMVSYGVSVIIKILIAPWNKAIEFEHKSIDGAGKYIGILERLFVFTFVVLGTWSAIGFLITAKSVFRFGDLNEGKNRKLTEYVLIGTLLSFGMAILLGLAFSYISIKVIN